LSNFFLNVIVKATSLRQNKYWTVIKSELAREGTTAAAWQASSKACRTAAVAHTGMARAMTCVRREKKEEMVGVD
jgi:hypothetical protein